MTPSWLVPLAIVYISLSLVSSGWAAFDIFVTDRRQPMGVMDAVWPLTRLYWGPIGLVFYYWFGRTNRTLGHNAGHSEKPMWPGYVCGRGPLRRRLRLGRLSWGLAGLWYGTNGFRFRARRQIPVGLCIRLADWHHIPVLFCCAHAKLIAATRADRCSEN